MWPTRSQEDILTLKNLKETLYPLNLKKKIKRIVDNFLINRIL